MGDDNTDFVTQWSDNPDVQPWGTDRMKFIFSSQFTGDHTGQGSEYGLEAMRLWPKNKKEVNVGIGDFFAYGGDPTERLHVRDGRVRIQQLPTDSMAADTLLKFLVVDDVDSTSPEYGVIKWRYMSGSDCDWVVTPQEHVVTAYSGMPCVPDDGSGVGIGNNTPKAKLDVVYTGNASHGLSGNLALHSVFHRNVGGWGILGYAAPWNSFDLASGTMTGVQGTAGNSEVAIGVRGQAANFSANTSTDLYGIYGSATGYGHAVNTYGVYGEASGSIGGNDWAILLGR